MAFYASRHHFGQSLESICAVPFPPAEVGLSGDELRHHVLGVSSWSDDAQEHLLSIVDVSVPMLHGAPRSRPSSDVLTSLRVPEPLAGLAAVSCGPVPRRPGARASAVLAGGLSGALYRLTLRYPDATGADPRSIALRGGEVAGGALVPLGRLPGGRGCAAVAPLGHGAGATEALVASTDGALYVVGGTAPAGAGAGDAPASSAEALARAGVRLAARPPAGAAGAAAPLLAPTALNASPSGVALVGDGSGAVRRVDLASGASALALAPPGAPLLAPTPATAVALHPALPHLVAAGWADGTLVVAHAREPAAGGEAAPCARPVAAASLPSAPVALAFAGEDQNALRVVLEGGDVLDLDLRSLRAAQGPAAGRDAPVASPPAAVVYSLPGGSLVAAAAGVAGEGDEGFVATGEECLVYLAAPKRASEW